MKKILPFIIAGFILSGCAGNKPNEKAVLDTVMRAHDKVMGEDEQLMKNKALLDSMAKHDTTAVTKDSIIRYLSEVTNADSSMDTWMHNFDPDMTGKLPDERTAYLRAQKKLILKVDSQVNAAVINSGRYLKKMKMK